jgi:predicted RNA binding protein YcfA (HicA-like mRNA interferase family)
MSKQEKLIRRFCSSPTDFTWEELVTLLTQLGFEAETRGKTGGSRRAFFHPVTSQVINLHKPHPGNIVKQYIIRQLKEVLKIC